MILTVKTIDFKETDPEYECKYMRPPPNYRTSAAPAKVAGNLCSQETAEQIYIQIQYSLKKSPWFFKSRLLLSIFNHFNKIILEKKREK